MMGNFIRLMRYIAEYWYLFALGLALTVVSGYLRVVPGLATRDVLNILTPPINADDVYSTLHKSVLLIFIASILGVIIGFAQTYLQQYISQKVAYNLRNNIFNALTQKSSASTIEA